MSNLPSYKGLAAPVGVAVNLNNASQVLTLDDAHRLLLVPEAGNGVLYTLPQPSEDNIGLWYEFFFVGDAASNETVIRGSSGVFDMFIGGSSAKATSPATTSEGGEWVKFIYISPTRILQAGGIAPWVTATT